MARRINLPGLVERLEDVIFRHRSATLGLFLVFTAVMGFFGAQLRMQAGFEKQIPAGHEYTRTFLKYKDDLFGANRIIVVVKARRGSIWAADGLSRLYEVTQAVSFLPNIDKLGVQSLWTPNSFVNEITEEGFRADPIIPGTITPAALTPEVIAQIRDATAAGGYIGTLVSRDETSAMITAELNERDAQGGSLDYVAFNKTLEKTIRAPFEDGDFEIQIIGFSKQIGDIADGASSVLVFCGTALALTAVAIYWYCRSLRLTVLPIVCSLTSLIWQFGTLRLLGFGLDPVAILVPFLVFSIGLSHGIQQINHILRELSLGGSSEAAARASFRGLLVPGALALITALVSFITLLLIPIPMVRELGITASVGVGFKIVTNLVMLPVAASLLDVTQSYAAGALKLRGARSRWLRGLAGIAKPRNACITLALVGTVFCVSAWESRDRIVGTIQPGAPELRADARFNRDAVAIAGGYDIGLDWLSVIFEAKADSCGDPRIALFQDDFGNAMRTVPGVVSIASYARMLRSYNEGYNEGNPKMLAVPIDPANYGALSAEIGRVRGYMNKDCSMTAVHLYLADHKATTIARVIDAARQYRRDNHVDGVSIRLAAGNAGVLAATDDEVAKSEMPMMVNVYLAIIVLVYLAYRDFRAVVACCLPVTVTTFVGYWFMKEQDIGLTVATLPVMVLAAGIGVDYAFYIYNRLQMHLSKGATIAAAVEQAILEVGVAAIFTAITLAVGVATWSFSPLKFQADMGRLLTLMFLVNLMMAITTLPALAVVMEHIFPHKRAPQASVLFDH